MNLRTRWFDTLEFILRADSAAKMFESTDREHYTVIGHDTQTCSAIQSKRLAHSTTLDAYLADHEYFDGELTFADPWPCSKCIPTEKLPPVELGPLTGVQKVPTTPTAKSNLNPYRTTVDANPAPKTPETTVPDDKATDGQVRKLMALYRKQKPEATQEQVKAAEERAKAMTRKQASTVIDKLEKGEKPAEAHTPGIITKGSMVTDGTVTAKVFWAGTGKSGAPRYGIVWKDASGNEQKVFAESGWRLASETGRQQ
jgi:hypothetical protein